MFGFRVPGVGFRARDWGFRVYLDLRDVEDALDVEGRVRLEGERVGRLCVTYLRYSTTDLGHILMLLNPTGSLTHAPLLPILDGGWG